MMLVCRILSGLLPISMLVASIPTKASSMDSSTRQSYQQAHTIIARSAEKIDQFDSTAHWDSVKNLTGVAKAIVVFPFGGQGGLLIVYSEGRAY